MGDKKQCKVKVIIRVRPPLSDTEKTCVNVHKTTVEIFNHRNVTETLQYNFPAVFGGESTQQQIYTECVGPLLHNSLQGQHVSIFAYGPTGAGKTHTMLGTPSNPGVIPRVINGLFQKIEEEKTSSEDEWKYKVTFSYLEIYNEKVQDLLEPSNADLPIREDADKNILVPGLAKKEIHNFDDFKMSFGPASNNRTVASTKLNNHSSRSHSIVQLTITKSKPCHTLHGKIYLIDLAGSEDNRRTGNKGIRLKESGAINKSLFALGEVVDAINSGLPRIPYRNSKLTRLLQDSIGGTCHSVMITNLAPEERFYYDTYCTLNFATKSKKIVNSTVVKETIAIVKPMTHGPATQKIVGKTRPVQEVGEPSVKRARLLDSSTDSLVAEENMQSLSPLMKRQAQMEETMNKRLEELEKNLIKQMTQNKVPTTCLGDQTPKTKAIHEMQKQLEASHAQLKELASRHALNLPQAPDNTQVKTNTVLKDKTNQPCVPPLVKGKARPLTGIKRKKEEEFSCSPLFAPPPSRIFKKGFTSSASGSNLKETCTATTDKKPAASETSSFNNASQQNRNEEFLNVINTSSIKDLQSLQTVGAKRAKLIYEWRETYGKFASAEDLKQVPGFTEKTFQKLLHNNLITSV